MINKSTDLTEKTSKVDHLIPQSDFTISNKNSIINSETYGLLLYALSSFLYGVNSFQVKYLKILYPLQYDGYLLSFWRSIAMMIISLIVIKYNKIEIIEYNKIQNKFWFLMRTVGQYFAFVTYIFTLLYLRVSTANCIKSMFPAVVVIFTTFILKEKFHSRYLFGISICFIGSVMIIMNDKQEYKEEEDYGNIIYGGFWALINLFLVAMLVVSSKVLVKEKIGFENQCYYISLVNGVLSLLSYIPFGEVDFFSSGLSFTFYSLVNGVIFYAATQSLINSIRWVDLNKTTPLAYIGMLTVFILGVSILGEPVYFTDVLGSLIILGYNVYNSYYPVK